MDLFKPICNITNIWRFTNIKIISQVKYRNRTYFFIIFIITIFWILCVGKGRFTGCNKTIKELIV